MVDELILPELSYRVIGCFYEVHRVLGPGFLESSYQEALAAELRDRGLRCVREAPIALHYKGRPIHGFRLDMVVEDKIVLECKTADSFHPTHLTQLANYLRVSELPLGILLYFGSKAVFKRVVAVQP